MRNGEWFKEWFNSPYYPVLYKNRDNKEARQFIDNLVSFLEIKPGSYILDAGCGRGRHSVYLAEKGFNVTGTDISESSTAYAKQFGRENLEFYIHDMRLPFRVNYYDYVLNLFSSFGYFKKDKEQYDTVKYAAQALRPQGVLVIDFMNVKKVLRDLVPAETKKEDGIVFNIRRHTGEGFIVKSIDVIDGDRRFGFEERVKIIGLPEFENYFKPAGLKVAHLFGDYDLNKFDPENSERLIILAQKTS